MVKKLYEKNGVIGYEVNKLIDDKKMESYFTKKVSPKDIHTILDHDADVYNTDGKLLLKFRKKKLTDSKIKQFYDNVIKFATTSTCNRGSTSGSKNKDVRFNPKIMTNIFGYMDGFSPSQKKSLREKNLHTTFNVRTTRFTQDYPEKYQNTIPLIKEIDNMYKHLLPDEHHNQYKKAKESAYKISNTAFTTVTTNVNFQTRVHKDKGDDSEGFGNLIVIEDGKYKGAETCFPQYGIGVNVRTGDMLFMDVHEWHGNLPMVPIDKNAKRLSIVCYLRLNVWKWSRNMTASQIKHHNKIVEKLSKARVNNKCKKTKKKLNI